MLDVMINHMSRQSPEFRDFERRGRQSPYADLFVTLDKVWPNGDPPAGDVAKIFLRKPASPFTTITIAETGASERIWTSFGTADWSEQVDLDVTAPATRALIIEWLRSLAAHHVRGVRLDAVGYVTKRPGTSCFMVEPEIYEFLAWITGVADGLGLMLLPEVHDRYDTHLRLAALGHWTYDFVLPGLLLDAFYAGRADRLAAHLAGSPARQFTTLDCHDGIPVHPDLDDLLEAAAVSNLAERIVESGGNVTRLLSPGDPSELDVHQLNCTYYSALGGDDDRYLAARAIQLFARGVPQVYYVGLLAGSNDQAAVERTGEGRAVNRHDYTTEEVRDAVERPVVGRLTRADPAPQLSPRVRRLAACRAPTGLGASHAVAPPGRILLVTRGRGVRRMLDRRTRRARLTESSALTLATSIWARTLPNTHLGAYNPGSGAVRAQMAKWDRARPDRGARRSGPSARPSRHDIRARTFRASNRVHLPARRFGPDWRTPRGIFPSVQRVVRRNVRMRASSRQAS